MARGWISVLAGCGALLVGCGSASQPAKIVTEPPSQQAFVSLPTGSPSSDYWIAGRLPRSYDIVSAAVDTTRRAYVSTYSTDPTRNRSNAPLQVATYTGAVPRPTGRASTVRGHQAILSTLTDEDRPYGVSLTWHERKNLTIVVSALEGLTAADARLVAGHVRPVSPDIGRRLVTATADIAGHIAPGMPRATAVTGQINGHRWTMTALLPSGYPVLTLDRRAACYELTYRGQRSTGSACWGHSSWARLGGRVFVFGEASPDVRRVVVRSVRGDVTVQAHQIKRWSRARFWVAPMPTSTCYVNAEPGDHVANSDVHTLGPTGPLDEQTADHSRCVGAPEPPRAKPPATKPGGLPTVVSAPAPPPTTSATTR